jgi:hypothetical protein
VKIAVFLGRYAFRRRFGTFEHRHVSEACNAEVFITLRYNLIGFLKQLGLHKRGRDVEAHSVNLNMYIITASVV